MNYTTYLKKLTQNHIHSFSKFVLVGLITATIYFGLFGVLWKHFELNYQIAITIAYVFAVIFYFLFNRHFTFRSTVSAMNLQFIKFLFMLAFNYLMTLTIVHISVEQLSVPPYAGMVLSIGIMTLINYSIAKFWVFKIKN